jgi:hypothetical protein
MSGDDRKASSKPSFLYGSTASKRDKAAQHATGGEIYSPEQMPSFVPLGHDQAEHPGMSQQGFKIELQSILDKNKIPAITKWAWAFRYMVICKK